MGQINFGLTIDWSEPQRGSSNVPVPRRRGARRRPQRQASLCGLAALVAALALRMGGGAALALCLAKLLLVLLKHAVLLSQLALRSPR